MIRKLAIGLLAAIAFAAGGAGFAVLLASHAKAQTYGQVIWGQQQGTTSPSIAIFDGTQNVSIGTLNTLTHTFVPVFPPTLPSGLIYPNPTFTGTVIFPSGVTMDSPIFTGNPTAPTPLITDSSTSIATTAFVRSSALCQNALQLGFTADGATDNLSAWNAWVTAQGSSSACLWFPAGSYKFTGPALATVASGQVLSVYGTGLDSTEWWFPNSGNGFAFTFTETSPAWLTGSSINVKGGSITTSQTGTGDGIHLSGNGVVGQIWKSKILQNLAIRGHTSSSYWTNGINIQGVQSVFGDNLNIYGPDGVYTLGNGITFNGPNGSNQALIMVVSNSQFTFLNNAVVASGTMQGVYLDHLVIEGVTKGVLCGDGTAQASQCEITNSSFTTAKGAMVLNQPGGAVITGNQIIQGNYAGGLTTDFMITLISAPGTSISANTFFGTTTGGGGLPSCVDISSTAGPFSGNPGTSITGNSILACTTTVKYAATSLNIASVGNAITGTPAYTGFVCGTSGNIIMDAGTPAKICTTLSSGGGISTGTVPANTGTCAINTQVGGPTAGSFKANGACAAGTYILSMPTAPVGWACSAQDMTTPANTLKETAYGTASVTLTSTTTNLDQIVFGCIGF